MKKKSATPPIPALSVQYAHQLEAVELAFHQAIRNCVDAYGRITHELKADTYMRSYVVKFFSIYILAYKEFTATYLPLWIPDLKVKSIEWVITVLGDYRGVEREKLREYFANLDETLDEYLRNTISSSRNPLLTALANPNSVTPTLSSAVGHSTDALIPKTSILSFAEELEQLLIEARWKPEDIAEQIGINPRNVYRHLSSETVPTITNTGSYEAALTKQLKRPVKLPTPPKRQSASKTSAKRH